MTRSKISIWKKTQPNKFQLRFSNIHSHSERNSTEVFKHSLAWSSAQPNKFQNLTRTDLVPFGTRDRTLLEKDLERCFRIRLLLNRKEMGGSRESVSDRRKRLGDYADFQRTYTTPSAPLFISVSGSSIKNRGRLKSKQSYEATHPPRKLNEAWWVNRQKHWRWRKTSL